MCGNSHNFRITLLKDSLYFKENMSLLCEVSHMNAAEQLGSQLRSARENAGLSLRALEEQVEIAASTIGEYERGVRVPEADKLARIASATGHLTFTIDNFTFTVASTSSTHEEATPSQQLPFNFSGEYNYSKATLKIKPGRISVVFEGTKISARRVRIAASRN
jgi:transcriptional regulator with XRE-family HTH domain